MQNLYTSLHTHIKTSSCLFFTKFIANNFRAQDKLAPAFELSEKISSTHNIFDLGGRLKNHSQQQLFSLVNEIYAKSLLDYEHLN